MSGAGIALLPTHAEKFTPPAEAPARLAAGESSCLIPQIRHLRSLPHEVWCLSQTWLAASAAATDIGVVDQSLGAYTGLSGSGVFDPLAVTGGLDGAALGLGGQEGSPGVIVVKFTTGSMTDGTSSDVRFYDTFGGSGV